VGPDEYKEFLSLGHGDIFDLDLDRWAAAAAALMGLRLRMAGLGLMMGLGLRLALAPGPEPEPAPAAGGQLDRLHCAGLLQQGWDGAPGQPPPLTPRPPARPPARPGALTCRGACPPSTCATSSTTT
jgi:hypothetical protein